MEHLRRSFLLGFWILLAAIVGARSQSYVEREIRIPWVLAGHDGLDALLVYVDLPGKHPLVVLTHGSPRNAAEHADVNPWQELPQALWFARRGWVALVIVRRGYGTSGGDPDSNHGGHCPRTDYQEVGEYSAEDMRIAIDYARGLTKVDATHVIAAGVSSGGFATVALTDRAPFGLEAAINFAGGRGSQADHDVCNPGDLVGAYRNFGKTSRIPMLWIYAQNDKFFWPELAHRFDEAFRSKGGQDQFVLAPPDGDDNHHLFRHVSAWSAIVDDFLKQHHLEPLSELLPNIQPPNLPPPPDLSEQGLNAFRSYLLLGPHKAFAVSEHFFGLSTANMNTEEAEKNALDKCRQAAQKKEICTVVYIDDRKIKP